MTNAAAHKNPALEDRGIAAMRFKREQREHPVYKTFMKAIAEERQKLLEQLAHPSNIEQTTLLRGELRLLSRISAQAIEVGPESRQSELIGPESATPALAAERFPASFD